MPRSSLPGTALIALVSAAGISALSISEAKRIVSVAVLIYVRFEWADTFSLPHGSESSNYLCFYFMLEHPRGFANQAAVMLSNAEMAVMP